MDSNSLNNEKEIEFFRLLIKFSNSSNNFSCNVPKTWNIKKLKNFISYSFKNEINKFNIIYCGKMLQKEEEILTNIFRKEEDLYMIFISYKQIEKKDSKIEQNLKDPSKFDVVGDFIIFNFFLNIFFL